MNTAHDYAVVIGASAGGIETLQQLVAQLPPNFPAPVFIVQHLPPGFQSRLPSILSAAGPLHAQHPVDGETIAASQIYVAPPDFHLLIDGAHIAVKRGPRDNRFRPSIDVLFRSAAYTYRTGAIGVVLSGLMSDGTSGLWTIKRLGGIAIVQDPAEALHPSMPVSALNEVEVDYSLRVSGIAKQLTLIVERPRDHAQPVAPEDMRRIEIENAISATQPSMPAGALELGPPSRYSCPECQGTLGRIVEGKFTRYRCHAGHGYSEETLLAAASECAEQSIAQTISILEEGLLLLEDIRSRKERSPETGEAQRYVARICEVRTLIDRLREIITNGSASLTLPP